MDELELVRQLRDRIPQKAEKIREDNRKRLNQVEKNAKAAVEELDKPVLDLGGNLASDFSFLPYAKDIVPNWQLLTGISAGSKECRQLAFDNDLVELQRIVQNFMEDIKHLRDKAPNLAHSGEFPREILVPVCAIDYVEGQDVVTKVFVAPQMDPEKGLQTATPWLQDLVAEGIEKSFDVFLKQLRELPIPDFSAAMDDQLKRFGNRLSVAPQKSEPQLP